MATSVAALAPLAPKVPAHRGSDRADASLRTTNLRVVASEVETLRILRSDDGDRCDVEAVATCRSSYAALERCTPISRRFVAMQRVVDTTS
jgi:hypothetical protein